MCFVAADISWYKVVLFHSIQLEDDAVLLYIAAVGHAAHTLGQTGRLPGMT